MYSRNEEEEYIEEGQSLTARLKDWFSRFRDHGDDGDGYEDESGERSNDTDAQGYTDGPFGAVSTATLNRAESKTVREREKDMNKNYDRDNDVRNDARAGNTSFGTAPNMRVSRVREQAIHVLSAITFNDIQKAADGLKQGIPQVINLEKADPNMVERLKDFMNGVTYALDGYVEKISEKSYLFTPHTVEIKSEPTPGATINPSHNTKTPFFDKL
jgi:FtsZ-interacting cell division protein YlmF